MEDGSNAEREETESLEHADREIGKKLSNLIRLAEDGNIGGDALRIRVNELEEERRKIAEKVCRAQVPRKKPDIKDLGQKVAQFILDFERHFEEAPIEEKKLLVQKCISKIEVDKEKRVARFYVRRVPAVLPFLEEANQEQNEASVMSKTRARDRT